SVESILEQDDVNLDLSGSKVFFKERFEVSLQESIQDLYEKFKEVGSIGQNDFKNYFEIKFMQRP
ncbi:MAG: hypothetical protein ACK55Z_02845, partial [bacterium]